MTMVGLCVQLCSWSCPHYRMAHSSREGRGVVHGGGPWQAMMVRSLSDASGGPGDVRRQLGAGHRQRLESYY